jgi:hypothetical protein
VAFARPYLRGASPLDPPVTVVVADVSGSLSDPRASRLRDLAAEAIDRAPASEAVALVQFSSRPTSSSPRRATMAPPAPRPRILRRGLARRPTGLCLAKAAELVARPGGHRHRYRSADRRLD